MMEKGTFAPTKTFLNTTEKRTFVQSGQSWTMSDKSKTQKQRNRCDGLLKRIEFLERKISDKQNDFKRQMQSQKEGLDKIQRQIETRHKEQDQTWTGKLEEFYSLFERNQSECL